MSFPVWLKKDLSDIIEINLPKDGVLVLLIGNASEIKSIASILNPEQIKDLVSNRVKFKNWVQTEALGFGSSCQFRLLGNEQEFSELASKLLSIGLIQGKHVPIFDNQTTLIHFLPNEGRVRMAKTEERKKIKVLVVDDSETIRKLLHRVLSDDPELECVATVEKPSLVEAAILKYKPDVLTLDIHMPEMDGVTLLKNILQKYTIPAIMISSLSKEEGTYVLDALEAGAVDYIQKPSMAEIKILAPVICEKIKMARQAKVQRRIAFSNSIARTPVLLSSDQVDFSYLIAIGSSTGGTEALKKLLTDLPENIPPIVIVQHIPPVFSKAFADRMNQLCPFEVKEASDGDIVTKNRVLVAPGGKQMKVVFRGGELKILIEDSPPVNRHKPSVDVLFDSIVDLNLKKVTAAILTGMGGDGARGLLKLKQKNMHTIAQDEASCVVYGMPKEAVKLGGVVQVLPLDQIAGALLKACLLKRTRAA